VKRVSKIDVGQIELPRAYQAVAQAISDKILSADWPVGMGLPGEVALADAFGVHRSTIREAIRTLEQEGLLVRPRATKQLLVNVPTRSQVSSRITAAIILQEITFLELWQTMMALEPASAEEAALRATPKHLAALRENHESTMQALGDPVRLLELDMAFLNGIAEASQNRALQLCRAPLGKLLYSAFLPVLRMLPAGERLVVAHHHILAALEAHDPNGAREWMQRHVADFRRGYERAGLDITMPVASNTAPMERA
jgi:GntR family transcriptional repressor for pyruvate dehydrogenase complex